MPEPNRPAITPAQITAGLLAGVPIIANLLSVFGVYSLSQTEQDALTSTMQWAFGVAGVLTVGDAYLRGKRNDAHARVAGETVHAQVYAANPPLDATGAPVVPPVPVDAPDALPSVPTTPAGEVPPDEGDAGNTP